MTDKDFCLSSFIALRYLWRDDLEFKEGFQHNNYRPLSESERIRVRSAEEIDHALQNQFNELYKKYSRIGILLSGGMDSANLASYLKPGSYAYTFTSGSGEFNADIERAKSYCEKWGLIHRPVEITADDFETLTPILMKSKFAPVHSIEPQIYKAAMQAKADGVEIMIEGDSADPIFGGMDKLISKEWSYADFVKRYTFLDPELVLTRPVSQNSLFEKYRVNGDKIDYLRFMDEVYSIESVGSYLNAFGTAFMPYLDPYEKLIPAEPLDLGRIRNGEPKYLVRELYALKYPEREIPVKIPMPRPVDKFFEGWDGPMRGEFKKDIPLHTLSGNQKWQLWCAERFLDMIDPS